MLDFLDRYSAAKHRERLDYCDHSVLQLGKPGTVVTQEMYYSLFTGERGGLNSYEREFLYDFMSPKALLSVIESMQKNITLWPQDTFELRHTYEEVLCMKMLPLLIKKYKELEELYELAIRKKLVDIRNV